MAYREFQYERTYDAPNTQGVLDEYTQSVSNLFQALNQKSIARKQAADQWKFDYSNGKYENDQKIISEAVKNTIQRGQQELYRADRISNDTHKMANDIKMWGEMSRIQKEKADDLYKQMQTREGVDKWYNMTPDYEKFVVANNGEDGQRNLFTRGDALSDFERSMGQVSADPTKNTFKNIDYRQNYIESLKTQYKSEDFGNPNVKRTRYDQSTFWKEDGTPGVTPEHARDYLKSEPRVDQYFGAVVNDQLDKEIDRMLASGDPRVAWMKGGHGANLTDVGKKTPNKEAIRAKLIADPSLNIINSKDYGQRKLDLARQDLIKGNRINSKVSTDYEGDGSGKTDGSGFNKNHTGDYVFFNENIGVAGIEPGKATSQMSGPAIRIMQKGTPSQAGKPVQMEITGADVFNMASGKTEKRRAGPSKSNIDGVQLIAYEKGGRPFYFNGNSIQEFNDQIRNAPDTWFKNLEPEMSLALRGYTISSAKILGDITTKEKELSEKIFKARERGDENEVANLAEMKRELALLKVKAVTEGDFLSEDIEQLAAGNGINVTRKNQLFKTSGNPSDPDLVTLRGITGVDMTNRDNWPEEMQTTANLYRQRYQEAKSRNFGEQELKDLYDKTNKPKKTTSSEIPTVTSQEAYDALPSGSEFIDPDGNKRRKP